MVLSALPDLESLSVVVAEPNGDEVTLEPEQFAWQPERNAVRLTDYQPALGAVVTIVYELD